MSLMIKFQLLKKVIDTRILQKEPKLSYLYNVKTFTEADDKFWGEYLSQEKY